MKAYMLKKLLVLLLTLSLVFSFSGFTLFNLGADATIKLKGDNVRISGSGVSYDDGDIVIEAAGTYVVKGTLNQGRIIVKAGEEDEVTVILNEVELTNLQDEALYFKTCATASLVLREGTENLLVSGIEPAEEASEETEETEEVSGAALRAKCPLTISGEGRLTVRGWINNGIASTESLVLESGTYDVQAVNDGIKSGAELMVAAGTYMVQAEHDGFSAGTSLTIEGGSFAVTTGVGADAADMKTGDSSMMGNMGGGLGNHRSSGEASGEASEEIAEETTAETTEENVEEPTAEIAEDTESLLKLGSEAAGEEITEPASAEELFIAAAEAEGAGDYFTARGSMPIDSTYSEETESSESETVENDASTDASTEMFGAMFPFGGNDFMDFFDRDSTDSGSQKGLKAAGNIVITGGDIVLDTEDDAIHSDGEVLISDGNLEIRSGDDGVHAESLLTISGGDLDISLCFEGLEANRILLSGGDVTVVAQDDGMNANGSGGFGMMGGPSRGMGGSSAETTDDMAEEASYELTTETVTETSGEISVDTVATASEGTAADSEADETWLRITDGHIEVTSGGDGLDSNGDLYIEGGEVYVSGPASDWDAAVDVGENAEFIISGGILAAGGYSGMAETPDSGDDTQCSIYYVSEDYIAAGTPVCLLDENGTELLRYAFANETNCVILSSPLLIVGETYTLQLGDESVTIEMTSANYSSRSGGMFGMGGMGGMGGGFGGR